MNPYDMGFGSMYGPFYGYPDYGMIFAQDDRMEDERDWRRMQEMYPETARQILPFVEEECDKMEYEGSMMFDEMPDRMSLERIVNNIRMQVEPLLMDNMEEMNREPEGMDIFTMESRMDRRRGRRQDWMNDFIKVLLFDEMRRRRRRRRDRRKGRFY